MKMLESTPMHVLALAVALRPAAGGGRAGPGPAGVREGRFDGGAGPGLRHLPRAERAGHEQRLLPRIAGKPAGYLYNQLVAFRDGTRSYPPMNYLVAYLPDAYLRDMAEHYAKLRPPFVKPAPPTADAAALARGKALVVTGDPAKTIPACAACHGKGLTGMEPGIPGLVGLRQTYIVGQLTSWRTGERGAAEPDCMKRIAARMSDADITAVAAWLASQDPPTDPSPESSNLVRMPFACGSQR
jgi:cytochrome c553